MGICFLKAKFLNSFYTSHATCQQRNEREKNNPWGFTALHIEEMRESLNGYQNSAFLVEEESGITQTVSHL